MATRSYRSYRSNQDGAVLYVALVFLVIMSLLGVAGMQVATLQERMASNYRASNIAFQRAEGLASQVEAQITTAGRFTPDTDKRQEQRLCSDTAAVRGLAWAKDRSLDDDPDPAVVVARLDDCTPGFSIAKAGRPVNEKPSIWQVSTFATDSASSPSSDAAVETVLMP